MLDKTTGTEEVLNAADLESVDHLLGDLELGDEEGSTDVIEHIGEKFDNLFQSIAAGRKPSVYTMHAYPV